MHFCRRLRFLQRYSCSQKHSSEHERVNVNTLRPLSQSQGELQSVTRRAKGHWRHDIFSHTPTPDSLKSNSYSEYILNELLCSFTGIHFLMLLVLKEIFLYSFHPCQQHRTMALTHLSCKRGNTPPDSAGHTKVSLV